MAMSRSAKDGGTIRQDADAQFWDDLLRSAIARDLCSKYEDTFCGPLPERLARLIDQLEARVQQTRSAALGQPLARWRIRLKRSNRRSSPAHITVETGQHTRGGIHGSD